MRAAGHIRGRSVGPRAGTRKGTGPLGACAHSARPTASIRGIFRNARARHDFRVFPIHRHRRGHYGRMRAAALPQRAADHHGRPRSQAHWAEPAEKPPPLGRDEPL